jgi:hypothetical protein
VAFGIPDQTILEAPAAVWQVELNAVTGDPLAERGAQVSALYQGLAQAEERLKALLAARAAAQVGTAVSFSIDSGALDAGLAEQTLSELLNAWEPDSAVSFGWIEDAGSAIQRVGAHVKELAGLSGVLKDFERMLEQFNRQFLRFAWVETLLDGRLAARTTVNWVGDMDTYWRPGLADEVLAAHQRSLQLALAARAASFQTITTVARMAAVLALAVSTPLGPLQAMALGWRFVQDVIQPLLRDLRQPA